MLAILWRQGFFADSSFIYFTQNLADVACEFGVRHFVYSSSERAEELYDAQAKEGSSHLAKVRIEERVKELGEKEGTFGWT